MRRKDISLPSFWKLRVQCYKKKWKKIRDVTISIEELQILTYDRHPWTLCSQGSLTRHNYCNASQPFIMVIADDPWHPHLFPSVCTCHYLFQRLGPGINTRSHVYFNYACIDLRDTFYIWWIMFIKWSAMANMFLNRRGGAVGKRKVGCSKPSRDRPKS